MKLSDIHVTLHLDTEQREALEKLGSAAQTLADAIAALEITDQASCDNTPQRQPAACLPRNQS